MESKNYRGHTIAWNPKRQGYEVFGHKGLIEMWPTLNTAMAGVDKIIVNQLERTNHTYTGKPV